MKRLFKGGTVINVFTDAAEKNNVLVENGKIIGIGKYEEADEIIDISGKYICPGFIDSHIHIESTMLLPAGLAKAAAPHGTTAIVTDPHEIANVCGSSGIRFMMDASKKLPVSVYFMIPSCVPSTRFDESGAVLTANDIEKLYGSPEVLGLAEMMNYPGVLCNDPETLSKIDRTLSRGLIVNGHAPLLTGKDLDKYIAAGITDDHECSNMTEALEKLKKGQRIMIRQGTAARNLSCLIDLFDEPYSRRCILATDDKHPADLISNGHIDGIIRLAVSMGKSIFTGIRMATIQAAEYYGMKGKGAIAPGYDADLVVLDDLESVKICSVYKAGEKTAENGKCLPFSAPEIPNEIKKSVCGSFNIEPPVPDDFHMAHSGTHTCRVIGVIKDQLITEEKQLEINFDKNNGVDTGRDILKIAVIERHLNTGHIGHGFITGIGLKQGAIASSVSHDSHNLIVIGSNDADMAVAAERIRTLGGGMITVLNGEVISEMPLPFAGLMTDLSPSEAAHQNELVRNSVYSLGVPADIEPFMTMAFVSLPVIPHLKLTTFGLVDVDKQELLPLIIQ